MPADLYVGETRRTVLPEGGNWYTPEPLFRDLESRYGPFDLDVAASIDNAKCARFYSVEEDGRVQPWSGRVWCNPPYRRLIEWVRKAYEEVQAGRCERVVMLLPAQTSTAWFHDYALPFGGLEWIRGRVRFGGCTADGYAGSVVVVFDRPAPLETAPEYPIERRGA